MSLCMQHEERIGLRTAVKLTTEKTIKKRLHYHRKKICGEPEIGAEMVMERVDMIVIRRQN